MKNDNIVSSLNERELIEALTQLCLKYEKRIAQLSEDSTGISGLRLKVCRRGKSFQCFLVDKKTGNTRYVSKKSTTVKRIAQSDYNNGLLPVMHRKLSLLKSVRDVLDQNRLCTVYDALSDGRKKIVTPEERCDEEFVRRWCNAEYEHKPFISDDIVFMTAGGLRVRSKSEIMIAEELDRRGIPYRYEYPVCIGGITFHPDFIILNKKTRREVIWEHFGLLDDSGYRDEFLKKIRLYENEGYLLGLNYVFTAETSRVPLVRADIVSVINRITE